MARHGRMVRSNRSRPNRSWSGIFATATISTASTKSLLASLVLSNQGIDETVLRCVGTLIVSSDQQGASEDQQGALGMAVVSDAALAVGATALPGPVTDISDDLWFTHVPFLQRFVFVSAIGVYPRFVTRYQFDFKSKRIVESGSSIAIMLESTSLSEGFIAVVVMRVLSMVRGTR